MRIEKKTLRNIFLVVAACIILYWILHEPERANVVFHFVKGIVSPFVTGAVLAFIANVPMRAIESKLGRVKNSSARRLFAVILTFVAILLVLSIVFWLLIPQLVSTIQSLIPKLQSFFLNIESIIRTFAQDNPKVMQWLVENTNFENINWADLVQNALSIAGDSLSSILSSAFSAIGSVGSAIMNLFIAIVFSLYCLFQKETLARQGRKLLYAFVPEKASDYIVRVLRLSNSTFSNFLSGQCVEVCILGCMFAVSMAIFRMPYIPLVSVLVAVTAFVPIVGAWIGMILGAFFMLVSNPIQAAWFIVMFVVLQQIENNLIYPRVVGSSIGISGMWVLVAVAVGGELMGVVGMLLMIPLSSVIITLLREFTHVRLTNKQIDPDKLREHPPELVSHFKEKRKKVKEKRKENRLFRQLKRKMKREK